MQTQENDWRKTLLREDATIAQAIGSLNDSGLQIVLIISKDNVLRGTITDGDIRRGLSRGKDLKSPIDSIIHRNAFVAPPGMSRDVILQLMRANRIHQMPSVDENYRVIGLHLWDEAEQPPIRPNIMVIMAGGFGTRLQSHTVNCPKPLLPVAGKPMLEHIIERARAEGFCKFVISIYYLGRMIEEYFGTGDRWQVQIDYLREKEPLGTAGAISLLNPRPEMSFVVTNGDVLTNIRYGELLDFHSHSEAAATMASRLYEHQNPFGVVNTQGMDIVGFEEKPVQRSYINAGVYAISPAALECMVTNAHCNMTTLFERLRVSGKRTIIYPTHESWIDVGRPEDLKGAKA